MRILRRLAALSPLLLGWPSTLLAQFPGSGQTGLNAALLNLFGDTTSFSSRAEIRLQEKGGKEPVSMLVDFSMLDGNVRMDLDMSALKSSELPPAALAGFKLAGLDKVVTVIKPHQKSAVLFYPAIRSYAELPMSKEEAAEMNRKFTLDKTRVSRETIEGTACEKTKVVAKADNGEKYEALVWYAPSLKQFPMRIQMDQQQTTVVMQYRDVKLVRPDPRQFEPPAGFTRYTSVEELMQGAMLKAFGNGKKK
jgi:hypothetical protein